MPETLDAEQLGKIDGYWRAANYLPVGQIYLMENPLLREPLRKEQIKPRLLGHFGTTPGLNFVYAHMNRVIKAHDLNGVGALAAGTAGQTDRSLAVCAGARRRHAGGAGVALAGSLKMKQ
jgi:xylulose-5-phosphate/fructose-6-phosphate phosphoketolase